MTSRARRSDPTSASTSIRRTGRHAAAERTVVRLTDAAVTDLEDMVGNGDPQAVRWGVKKCLLLERNPEAGEGLRGALIGYRKLTVGDRNWRIIWRVTHDDEGRPVVDVAEVWALGSRSDSEVYAEMRERVVTLSASPATVPLAEVLQRLGRIAAGLQPRGVEPEKGAEKTTLPDWLTQALLRVVGLSAAEIDHLSEDEARRIWGNYTSAPR